MFKDIEFSKVLVTGPARSGTHICAVMVAYDTDLCFVPEQTFKCNDIELFRQIYWEHDNFVVPCNGIRKHIGEFGQDDTLIIVKYRPVAEIVASGRRVRGELSSMKNPRDYVRRQYKLIEAQLPLVKHYVKIKHHSLTGHPLWVERHRRKQFDPRQVHCEHQIHELVEVCSFVDSKLWCV